MKTKIRGKCGTALKPDFYVSPNLSIQMNVF